MKNMVGQEMFVPRGKRDPMRNIEKYTFPLLCHEMGLKDLEFETAAKYSTWLLADLPVDGRKLHPEVPTKDVLSKLCNAGSDNHLYLMMACALWFYREAKVELWRDCWVDLLSFQTTGRCPWDGMQELALWEHTETHSTTYSSFRWVSVLAVWKWARDHHDALLAGLCETYCQAMAAWWGLGAVLPWKGLTERENAKGELYDSTPLVPACGERSTLAHAYQNDLGSLLSHAGGSPERSKRLNPYVKLILDSAQGEYAALGRSRAELLQRLGIRTNREIIWEFWKDVTLVYCPGPRLNGNTPDTKYWVADHKEKTVTIGFPWVGGRGDATKGLGGSCYRDSTRIFAQGNGEEISSWIPMAAPDLKIVINREGVKIS